VATFLYGKTSESFAEAQLVWESLVVWGLLVDHTYTPQVNADKFVSNIPASSIIARIGPMTSQATANGVCSGLLPTFNSLINPLPAAAVVLYINTNVDTTSQLLYYSSDGIGFPLPLQGFNYAIAFDQTLGGWFQV
jgi:hypothetical protein